jgi:hypothetical protein
MSELAERLRTQPGETKRSYRSSSGTPDPVARLTNRVRAPAPDMGTRTKDSGESKRETGIGNEEIDDVAKHERQVGRPHGASSTRKTEAW